MNHLGEGVDPHLNSIMPITNGQRTNKIHRYDLPWPLGNPVHIEFALFVAVYSCPLARLTLFNILRDLVAKSRPPIITLNHFLRPVLSGMTKQGAIMVKPNDLIAQFLIPRNINEIVIINNAIFLLPSREFLLKSIFNALVDSLCLENLVPDFLLWTFELDALSSNVFCSEVLWFQQDDIPVIVFAHVMIRTT